MSFVDNIYNIKCLKQIILSKLNKLKIIVESKYNIKYQNNKN